MALLCWSPLPYMSIIGSVWAGIQKKLSESWIIKLEMEYRTFFLPAQSGNERVSSQILFPIQVRRAQKDLLVNVEWSQGGMIGMFS